MRVTIASLAFAAVLGASIPAAAQTAPPAAAPAPLKALRTLVYDLQLGIGNARVEHNSGLTSGEAAAGGSGRSSYQGGGESRGQISVDVMAATVDNYLVVDVRENATGRNRPAVRVAIASNGDLRFDPKESDNLTVEEIALLRWLARGFGGDVPEAPGAVWDVPQLRPGATGIEHYRAVAVDGAKAKLDYRLEIKRGPGSAAHYDATRVGSLTYDAKLSVPTDIAYQEVAHQDGIGGTSDTTTTSLVLKLVKDSFAPKPAAGS